MKNIEISRRQFITGAIGVVGTALTVLEPNTASAGTPDQKLEAKAKKESAAPTTLVTQEAPAATLATTTLQTPGNIDPYWVRPGIIPNLLKVRFDHYSAEPAIFQRESFKWDGKDWAASVHDAAMLDNWAPMIGRGGLPAGHDPEGFGPKYDQFVYEVYGVNPMLTDQLRVWADVVIKFERERGGSLTGSGHCYAQASFLALEKPWANGYYNPNISRVNFSRSILGQGGTLYYSSVIPFRDVNENDFAPDSQAYKDAIVHNNEWALRTFVGDGSTGEPMIVDMPLNGDSTASWWRVVRKASFDATGLNVSKFAYAHDEDASISQIRGAYRPIHPESAEAKSAKFLSHPAWFNYRDEDALGKYTALDGAILRHLLYPNEVPLPQRPTLG